MKRYILNIVIPVLALCGLAACSDWTEAEPTYKTNMDLAPKSPEYYAKLRDWKFNDDHPRTFGWYGNWTARGASGEHRLMGLPDSVDFVSMWGNWWGLSEDQMRDKKEAYEIKGLRVKICFIISDIGSQTTPRHVRENWQANGFSSERAAVNDFWGWKDGDDAAIEAAIQKYAQSICDTIIKYDFKGFDFDLEAHYGASGNIASYPKRITIFLKEMSKVCGPKSGTDRLLCVDGEPNILEPECAELLDFFILQAYYASSYSDLEGTGYTPRINPVLNNFKDVLSREEIMKKIIVCEDFEQQPEAGGKMKTFRTRDGRQLPPIWGMADYFTEDGIQIGGTGIYHMEYDYPNTYATIQTAHKGKEMDLSPASVTGTVCYGYLNGVINLLHNPKNPAAKLNQNK